MILRADQPWGFETLGDKQLEAMQRAAIAFTKALASGTNPHWLSFLGTSGAGKTFLAKMISKLFREYLRDQLIPGQDLNRTQWRMKGGFLSWRKLCQQMRDGNYSSFRAACEDYFVVIDDIGAGHDTAFAVAKLDELFDARVGKWTINTANMGLDDIRNVDARLASRMLRNGSVVVDVDVEDWNVRKKSFVVAKIILDSIKPNC